MSRIPQTRESNRSYSQDPRRTQFQEHVYPSANKRRRGQEYPYDRRPDPRGEYQGGTRESFRRQGDLYDGQGRRRENDGRLPEDDDERRVRRRVDDREQRTDDDGERRARRGGESQGQPTTPSTNAQGSANPDFPGAPRGSRAQHTPAVGHGENRGSRDTPSRRQDSDLSLDERVSRAPTGPRADREGQAGTAPSNQSRPRRRGQSDSHNTSQGTGTHRDRDAAAPAGPVPPPQQRPVAGPARPPSARPDILADTYLDADILSGRRDAIQSRVAPKRGAEYLKPADEQPTEISNKLRKFTIFLASADIHARDIDGIFLDSIGDEQTMKAAKNLNTVANQIYGRAYEIRYRGYNTELSSVLSKCHPGVLFTSPVIEQLIDDDIKIDDPVRFYSDRASGIAKDRFLLILKKWKDDVLVTSATGFGDSGKPPRDIKREVFQTHTR
ncbi:hypothetical protein LTR37_020734 [Vermiconidia calcicola]|uniref:Uncharacterized protein n=1 Tax=Vermiconidia calcicola TaxID=1690605 RepID=A0ACC3MBU3_9PEZI|nr:hypothetical protein LTR37_020734 [Vermiconidia calcicola]